MKKLLVIILPVFLMLFLMVAPSASAQSTYTLSLGETVDHSGRTYQLTGIVSGASKSCSIAVDGVDKPYVVGDTVGDLKLINITVTGVVLEVGQSGTGTTVENEDGEPAIVSALRYRLDSGDILLFSDDSGINGALAYIFGETLDPTFLFWAGGRLPTVSSTPTPDEKVSLGVGQSYTSKTIWDLEITVESVEMDRAVVVFATDDSISLMKTVTGGEDVSELVERLWSEYTKQFPVQQSAAPVDTSGIYIIAAVFAVYVGYNIFDNHYRNWGRRP